MFFAALLAAFLSCPALAGDLQNVTIADLTDETMQHSRDDHSASVVWWLPDAFWEIAMQNEPSASPELKQQVKDVFEPYMLLAVVQGRVGPMGAITFSDDATVRQGLTLVTPSGVTLQPMDEDDVSPNALMFTRMMQPVLKGAIGSMGEHMGFYFFKATDKKGAPYLDPRADQRFEVHVGDERFAFQLPLESLYAKVNCPKCGRLESGAWTYCPYDGTPLGGKSDEEGSKGKKR